MPEAEEVERRPVVNGLGGSSGTRVLSSRTVVEARRFGLRCASGTSETAAPRGRACAPPVLLDETLDRALSSVLEVIFTNGSARNFDELEGGGEAMAGWPWT